MGEGLRVEGGKIRDVMYERRINVVWKVAFSAWCDFGIPYWTLRL